ncbi:glycosyltransferase family 4 protein [Aerosakkonemataceae cyanobacterium BLCC-F154]|uniref:Glycosyltransferase family 4 protein n=1 Tax=Floridaenema fluviatile BLCC-F154 TaxID=3153640 RepID=A0ABV4Y7F5_9CYAN
MLRVLHLIHGLNRGGIEKWLITMLRQIPRSECEMDFCCKGAEIGDLAPIVQELGAKVYHCPLTPGHFDFIQCLKGILIEGEYQILHNHLGIYSGVAVWLAHQQSIPVITSFHNTQFPPETNFTRLPIVRQLRSIYGSVSVNYALHYSDLVTGCSQGVIKSLDPQGTKIKNGSEVLYYGVNLPDISTPEERTVFRNSFGWSADTPVIIHVGRLIEQKNHLGMLSVFQKVLEQIPTVKLLLVGEGLLRSLIEQTIAQRQLEKSVLLLGLRDDVPWLMSQCNVFLLPSFHEGLPVVALEANAANLPVVGSNIPGLTEAVLNGETALLHDVEDLDGMANSVIKILSDRQYAQQLAQAGRAWVKENYSLAVSANHLVNIYRSVIKT